MDCHLDSTFLSTSGIQNASHCHLIHLLETQYQDLARGHDTVPKARDRTTKWQLHWVLVRGLTICILFDAWHIDRTLWTSLLGTTIMTDRHPLYSHLSINTHSPPTGNVLTCKEGYQRENGRKHVGDKGKCCPWYFRAPMSINRALGKKAGNQQSEASSRNFFWGAAIRDLTPSCLGRLTATCHVIPHHMRVDIDRGRPDWGIGYTDLSAVRSTFVACFESKELVPKDLQQQVGFRYLKLGVHFYWKRRRNKNILSR